MKQKNKPRMPFDLIPFIIFNSTGILALVVSRVYSNYVYGRKIDTIINNLNNLKMATEQQFTTVIDRIDAATTHIAAQVTAVIIPEIKAQGLPATAEDSIVGKLTDLASRLESIGGSLDEPLPGVVGSSTPVPLGEAPQESNTGATEADNTGGDTNTQPVISDANTGQNTPASDGAEVDQSKANATMNPFSEPAPTLPGDKVTSLNGDNGAIQVGKQPDANNGDTQTDPNKDSNPANDEALPDVAEEAAATAKAKSSKSTKADK